MSNTLLYTFGFIGAFLLLVIIQQWLHIQALLREKLLSSKTIPLKNKVQLDPLLSESPFPLCVVDETGTINWATSKFWKLVDAEKSHTLNDVDAQLGSSLQELQKKSATAHHFYLSTKSEDVTDGTKRRLYTVITWPYQQHHQRGIVFCFIEQTSVHQRYLSSAAFENQLIRYLGELTTHLNTLVHDSKLVNALDVQKQATEAQTIVSYLESMHHPMRRQHPHLSVNIVALCKTTLLEERTTLHRLGIHIINTLPHTATVLGNAEEYALVLHLILEALEELAGQNQDLRIHIQKEKQHVVLSFTLPGVIVQEEWLHHLFGFGRRQGPLERLSRLKLALAQQIVLKYHGKITASSADHLGTVFEIFFANAERETLQ